MQQKTIKKNKNRPVCEIHWNILSASEWDKRFKAIRRSSLLQSYPYGLALARLNQQSLRHGVIVIDGEEVGLVQILEAKLIGQMIHGLIVDRGPVWFDGRGGASDMAAFLRCFNQEFPKRLGRRVRFIPECSDDAAMKTMLYEAGFKPVSQFGYQTIWLDLSPTLDELRAGLSSRWRRQLKKSEKSGLELVVSDGGHNFAWLMQHYSQDRRERGYDGVSLKTMVKLAAEFSRGKSMIIATAMLDSVPIAGIVILIHGSSATYQVGYAGEAGRETRAHYALLWEAVKVLKERDIHDFDLGGVNDASAKGVKEFKQGMGGALIKTLGMYRR